MTKQIFGSALSRPWALVKWGGDQPNGRRPSTAVAYITDPIKNAAGEITGYDGGLVEFYRKAAYHTGPLNARRMIPGEPNARWHFRYQRARTFSVDDVCTWFPCGKSRDDGPTQAMVRAAKLLVPKNRDEEADQHKADQYAISNGLSVVLSDGTLIQPSDEEDAS